MPVFDYGETELRHLRRKDKKLACAIEQIGPIERAVNSDLFTALIHSIVGQQVATKAAVTVWNRLLERCGEITPQCLYAMDAAEIQQCGLSMRKARYIHGASRAVAMQELVLEEFPSLPDAEIIRPVRPGRHRRLDGRNAADFFVATARCRQLGRPGDPARHDGAVRAEQPDQNSV